MTYKKKGFATEHDRPESCVTTQRYSFGVPKIKNLQHDHNEKKRKFEFFHNMTTVSACKFRVS